MMTDIFLQLVNMSLTACWLIAAVLLLRLVFRRAPRWIFCLLWGFVGLRLVLPFSFESIFSLIPTRTPVQDAASNLTDRIVVAPVTPAPDIPITGINPTPVVPDSGAALPDAVPMLQGGPSIAEISAVVWICGIAAMLVYALVSYIRLRVSLRTATIYRDEVWQSEKVSSPFVLGIVKPRIYLPYSLDELDIPYVLAHERAHIARRDHLIKPLGFIILSVYWFNPLIWLAYVLLCRDVEAACDERVIKSIGEDKKRNYSTALLNCSISRARIAACPIAFGEVAVKERIKSVMNYRKPTFWIIVLAIIAVAVTAVCFLTDPKTKDEEKEDDKVSEEYSDEPVEINFDRYEVDEGKLVFELKSEALAPVDPVIELCIGNDESVLEAQIIPGIELYRMEEGEWHSCRAFYPAVNRYMATVLHNGERVDRVYSFNGFDLTKAGQYRLDVKYFFTAYEGEAIKRASVYFDLSAPIANPLDNKALIRDDLAKNMSWLPQYMGIHGAGIEVIHPSFSSLYYAMRYCYENELDCVRMEEDSFRISRDDLLEVFMELTETDEYTAGGIFEASIEYLAQCGDIYDFDTKEYVFTLDRDNWGDNIALGIGDYMHLIDMSRGLRISEGYNFSTATVWMTIPSEDKSVINAYYETEFYFEHIELEGHIAYRLVGLRYLDPPILGEITLTPAQEHSTDGFYTEFILTVGDREKHFEGRAISDTRNEAKDQMVGYEMYNTDLTGDGIMDIIINLQISGGYSQFAKKTYEVHVFDGSNLEEIPVENDIPKKVTEMIDFSADDEQYVLEFGGEKRIFRKSWFANNPDYSSADVKLYDVPKLDESYIFTARDGKMRCELYCNVCQYATFRDMICIELEYRDGKLVLSDTLYSEGFDRDFGIQCTVHNDRYHNFSYAFIDLVGQEEFYEWLTSLPHFEYNDNGCTDPASVYSFAEHFGLNAKKLRNAYYLNGDYYHEYYVNEPPFLFELDENACDEFFRDPSNFDDSVYELRQSEQTFKDWLLTVSRNSDSAQERKAFQKFTNYGSYYNTTFWSIPEYVYVSGISLEELQQLYDTYIARNEYKYEYDFERIFTEREYFEEQIEKAEYPVFVDALLRK